MGSLLTCAAVWAQAQLLAMMVANIAHVLGGDALAASAAHCLVVYLHRLGGNSLPPESAAAFAVRAGAPEAEFHCGEVL